MVTRSRISRSFDVLIKDYNKTQVVITSAKTNIQKFYAFKYVKLFITKHENSIYFQKLIASGKTDSTIKNIYFESKRKLS